MSQDIPTFAVVGHPNKGKSSIVATLAEDDRVVISSTPGTTRRANQHTFSIDGQPQYALVDTPGFQRPGELLAWLQAHSGSASDRPGVVAAFVDAHLDDPRFADECELLGPLIKGAGILYVVDGAKPYGPEYELEMEVLRWTGRPRMALINLIGTGNFQEQWRNALGQYFSIVHVFDALHADFEKRVALLRAFGELDESWRKPLATAVAELLKERQRRRNRSAREIARCLVDALTYAERGPLAENENSEQLQTRLAERLRRRIRTREQLAQKHVQTIYRHPNLAGDSSAAEMLESDIFTRENRELFGLSQAQLAVTGALSGAAAGGGIDLMLGGASLLLGSGIGALVGGVGAWLGSEELSKVKVLGSSLGGKVLKVGPVSARSFPWVLLGRAWLHHHLIAERNHAHRSAVVLAVAEDHNLMNSIPDSLRKTIALAFQRIEKGETGDESYEHLVTLVDKLLALDPVQLTREQ